jgi:hypothetical protein
MKVSETRENSQQRRKQNTEPTSHHCIYAGWVQFDFAKYN